MGLGGVAIAVPPYVIHPKTAVLGRAGGEIYNGRFQINASGTCHFLSFYANLNLNELSTTLTLEKAIRALAHIGVIWKSMPKI